MNFLRHPLYSALALGACAWLSMANTRGLSMLHSANPVNWAMFNSGRSTGYGHSYSSGHISHK